MMIVMLYNADILNSWSKYSNTFSNFPFSFVMRVSLISKMTSLPLFLLFVWRNKGESSFIDLIDEFPSLYSNKPALIGQTIAMFSLLSITFAHPTIIERILLILQMSKRWLITTILRFELSMKIWAWNKEYFSMEYFLLS